MIEKKTAILVDSGCDVPQSFLERYPIRVLPLRVSYEAESHVDSVELAAEVYRRFPQEIPHTSTPVMQDFYTVLEQLRAEGYENILGVFISGNLSSTCQTAKLVLEEHPEFHSFVLDTRNISIGAGLLAMWAAVQLENGVSFEEVCRRLPEKVADAKVFFYMDTLEYLRKGGRIGAVTSVVGSLLKIKPIISCDEAGIYYTVEKIRGAKAGVSKLLEHAAAKAGSGPSWLALMHGGAPETMAQVKPKLIETIKKGTILAEGQITASLAVHTGPGLLGIGVLANP
ncbi:MAG TPA: DegV family protein [Candidatus Butyricicoccus stercorigallinarum]|nr:DegV family protein [Candidatus Butyricicoccus stercorigallinarum]